MAGPLPETAINAITRLADGSPFMASAVLRGLVESGALVRVPEGWRVDSLNIDDMQSSSRAAEFLTRRLELLPRDTVRLLSTGAVLGKEFEVDIAAELTEQSAAQTIMALDEARQRRLVWLRPDGSRCVFVHDKIRSAVLEGQAISERRLLHGRAAAYLQQHRDGRDAEVAYHFDAAGDSRSALPYAIKAASQSAGPVRAGSRRTAISNRSARRGTGRRRHALSSPRGARRRAHAARAVRRGWTRIGSCRGRRGRDVPQSAHPQQTRRPGLQTRRHGRSDRVLRSRLARSWQVRPTSFGSPRLTRSVGRPGADPAHVPSQVVRTPLSAPAK